ncbi:phospholipase C, phosphocholine-specific [Sphingobacterium sp. UT-1RO-CII-1]|uniref:phosphocholine-specific phospholipase C n=1 Tax=Sphingobacterium sp. UT-1RO-CII-1 TaxID=2995225 RepID=UPI00227B1476|nr:phospholipase C, phosphocholine-specific [Sphingobacterium sp. UT-1RO-CII-1]MCY4780253.1 phospholipase C, phosphocholine-specific [Sphingobacterium sp. UT-1RO-CII-1]
MNTRREFLKKASLLAGVTTMSNLLPESIQRALAINAPVGSTYLDAEHVVFLMQENRSFDHCYGTMRGVRGFNDPRAMKLPNGFPVWFQTDAENKSYGPFRLDIENTKTTWMGSLPHGWRDMVEARNNGKMDTWLEAKRPRNKAYEHLPLTMGYHSRQDIPFYYAFGDAFTVCDQHFCSSLTGTSANRSYFWSGAIREEPRNGDSTAHVDNGQINYRDVSWTTYPERLQKAGIDWKVYQNELSIDIGFEGEEDGWLANFTNNNLEFYKQYGVRFHPARRQFRAKRIPEIQDLLKDENIADETRQKLMKELTVLQTEHLQFSKENYDKLTDFEKQIHERALLTNIGDPDYHSLETISYQNQGVKNEVKVPKGDVLYQFRKDVNDGNLPTVSWLVAPGYFSDHPGYPWYGAWYVSEALDILTNNPEVWKKTIFILNYDENDGYFDHISPFVPPLSTRPESGAVASGIDTRDEYVTAEQEKKRTNNPDATIDSPIGLGYRVPLVVASPWSKGGWVNSEVCDLTSPLMFLEHFLEKKTGKKIIETNVSPWRRLVCGNLTSIFRPVEESSSPVLEAVNRNSYVERIHAAKDKDLPGNFHLLNAQELETIKSGAAYQHLLPKQEPGTKPACAIPYDAQADVFIKTRGDKSELCVRFELAGKLPKTKTVGIPFIVISRTAYGADKEVGRVWNFAVREQEPLEYHWPLDQFNGDNYHLEVYGPNGFFREFRGAKVINSKRSSLILEHRIANKKQAILLKLSSNSPEVTVRTLSYGGKNHSYKLSAGKEILVSLDSSHGWYDIEVKNETEKAFYQRYAGHVETGRGSQTDPLMGGE